MTIIYKTVEETLDRILKKNLSEFENYVRDLILLYEPKDNTKNKENLLTLYLNSGCPPTQIELFLTKKYPVQPDKIKVQYLDHLFKGMISLENWDFFEKLPKKNHIGYSVSLLNSGYRLELLKHFYDPKQIYCNDKFNIINDIFSNFPSIFEDSKTWIKYIQATLGVIQFLKDQGKIAYKDLECLTSDKNIEHFYSHIKYYQSEFRQQDLIKKTLFHAFNGHSNKPIGNTIFDDFNETVDLLKGFRATLEGEILTVELANQSASKLTPPKDIKVNKL